MKMIKKISTLATLSLILQSCADLSQVAQTLDNATKLTEGQLPLKSVLAKKDKRILKDVVNGAYTLTLSNNNKTITTTMDWWARFGGLKETFSIANLQMNKAEVAYKNVGPWNGLYQITIPLAKSHTVYKWAGSQTIDATDQDRFSSRPNSSHKVNNYIIHADSKSGASVILTVLRQIQREGVSTPKTRLQPLTNYPSVSSQRKKLEATGEHVGLFYIKHVNKSSNPVWNSSYIEGGGNAYEKSYQAKLRDAKTKLNSLNSQVKGEPYYITVGGY